MVRSRARSIGFTAVFSVVLTLGPAYHAGTTSNPGTGLVGEQPVTTSVDTELAASYLRNDPAGQPGDVSRTIGDILAKYETQPLDWHSLQALTSETSLDFATIYFARRVLTQAENRRLQQEFLQEVRHLRKTESGRYRTEDDARAYRFLFVPGFHYRTDRHTGADFAGPRAFLSQLGLQTVLIETEEDGTVEENAQIIARAIRREMASTPLLILVSASKGGPEVALTFGKFLTDHDAARIKAWVSVGGLLNGTYLADHAVTWPTWWLARVVLWLKGIDARGIKGLTVEASRPRFASLRFPEGLFTLQYIGVPLSGQISEDVAGRYAELAAYGPNDGLTLLADELVPGGHVILEPGLDHFFRDPEIHLKTLALANVVVREIRSQQAEVR